VRAKIFIHVFFPLPYFQKIWRIFQCINELFSTSSHLVGQFLLLLEIYFPKKKKTFCSLKNMRHVSPIFFTFEKFSIQISIEIKLLIYHSELRPFYKIFVKDWSTISIEQKYYKIRGMECEHYIKQTLNIILNIAQPGIYNYNIDFQVSPLAPTKNSLFSFRERKQKKQLSLDILQTFVYKFPPVNSLFKLRWGWNCFLVVASKRGENKYWYRKSANDLKCNKIPSINGNLV
jgi:hypothetical protein